MKNKVLVITGMHRSGTSLITQWLYKCGLHVGKAFLGADVGNADGHYEDMDFFHHHKRILTDLSLPDDGMLHRPIATLSGTHRGQFAGLLDDKTRAQDEWGWKDPRTCLFLPVYRELLPQASYLVILRDYGDVVSSLISRHYNKIAKKYTAKGPVARFIWEHFRRDRRKRRLLRKYSEHYLKVWIHYNREILLHLQSLPAGRSLVVEHSRLAENNRKVFAYLLGQWNFHLQYYNFDKVYKKQLLSHVLDIAGYIKDKDLLKEAQDLQQALSNHAI